MVFSLLAVVFPFIHQHKSLHLLYLTLISGRRKRKKRRAGGGGGGARRRSKGKSFITPEYLSQKLSFCRRYDNHKYLRQFFFLTYLPTRGVGETRHEPYGLRSDPVYIYSYTLYFVDNFVSLNGNNEPKNSTYNES